MFFTYIFSVTFFLKYTINFRYAIDKVTAVTFVANASHFLETDGWLITLGDEDRCGLYVKQIFEDAIHKNFKMYNLFGMHSLQKVIYLVLTIT